MKKTTTTAAAETAAAVADRAAVILLTVGALERHDPAAAVVFSETLAAAYVAHDDDDPAAYEWNDDETTARAEAAKAAAAKAAREAADRDTSEKYARAAAASDLYTIADSAAALASILPDRAEAADLADLAEEAAEEAETIAADLLETRTARALRLRAEYEAARTPATRAAHAAHAAEETATDALRTLNRAAAIEAEAVKAADVLNVADRLAIVRAGWRKAEAMEAAEAAARTADRLAAKAAEAADRLESTRTAYLAARSALLAADLLEYSAADPRALLDLCAASVSRAIDRREAETARDGRTLRAKYARVDSAAVLSGNADPMNADAVNEAAARLLDMVTGAWIEADHVATDDDGNETRTPRAALPLAYVAAIAAGKALDAVMYADGGHRAKLTAREAREAYRAAADLAPLADRADLLEEEAKADPTPERKAAAKAARADYVAASRNFAAAAVVVETRPLSDPVAPSPEAAAIEAERVARVLETVAPEYRENAAALARAIYEGAETIREAARVAGIPKSSAARAWNAVRNAAAVILAEDGETRDLERLIESDRRTREAMGRRRENAATAREADRLAREAAKPSPEASETTRALWADVAKRTRPERLAATARLTRSEYAAARDLARAAFLAAATR